MIKSISFAVLVLASAATYCCLADDYFYNEAFSKTEAVMPKLDFHRLHEIGAIKPVSARCKVLEREVREMLEDEARTAQSAGALLSMVAEIVRRKQPVNQAPIIADLELCAEKANADGVFAPPKNPSPFLMSNLDFRGIVDGVGSLTGDKRCLALEDEIRQQVNDFSSDSTDLLNKVTCYVDRLGTHLAHSEVVYNLLTECLGSSLRNFDEIDVC